MTSLEIPRSFNELCIKLDNLYHFDNILFVRHTTGGIFMNDLFVNKNNISRILYETDNSNQPNFNKSKLYTLIKHNQLQDTIKNLNKKFDLICLDPFHEYHESISDFTILSSFLTDNGILVCHDCCPPNKKCAGKSFTHNEWCGVTYGAFIELSLKNPNWYYAVLNKDYGLGILSKKEIIYVKKNLNHELQKIFVEMLKKDDINTYDFFKQTEKELINVI